MTAPETAGEKEFEIGWKTFMDTFKAHGDYKIALRAALSLVRSHALKECANLARSFKDKLWTLDELVEAIERLEGHEKETR